MVKSENIRRVTDKILDDYNGGRTIDAIKHFEHPDKKTIVDILEKLRAVIIPGYFENTEHRAEFFVSLCICLCPCRELDGECVDSIF